MVKQIIIAFERLASLVLVPALVNTDCFVSLLFQCGQRQKRHRTRAHASPEPERPLTSVAYEDILLRATAPHNIHHYWQNIFPIHTEQPPQNHTRRAYIHHYQRSAQNLPQTDVIHQTFQSENSRLHRI